VTTSPPPTTSASETDNWQSDNSPATLTITLRPRDVLLLPHRRRPRVHRLRLQQPLHGPILRSRRKPDANRSPISCADRSWARTDTSARTSRLPTRRRHRPPPMQTQFMGLEGIYGFEFDNLRFSGGTLRKAGGILQPMAPSISGHQRQRHISIDTTTLTPSPSPSTARPPNSPQSAVSRDRSPATGRQGPHHQQHVDPSTLRGGPNAATEFSAAWQDDEISAARDGRPRRPPGR